FQDEKCEKSIQKYISDEEKWEKLLTKGGLMYYLCTRKETVRETVIYKSTGSSSRIRSNFL
ncbi:MAG: hypothetical protein K2H18_02585, partial [Muribaculaceae bacterium]|nr:hypothetical protein [Muribaculaceae bacterium]